MSAKTNLSLLAGVALASGMGIANADGVGTKGPLALTDTQMDTVTAAGGVTFNSRYTKTFNVNENINIRKRANVNVRVDISGTLADAEAVADCFGRNCTAETFTGAQTSFSGADSFSKSIAATDTRGGG